MNSAEPSPAAPLAERYRALLELGNAFLGSSSSYELYQAIYAECAKMVELEGFLLSLYDDQRDVATVVFSMDDGRESEPGLTYRGSDSEALRTGTPTAIADQTDASAVLFPGDEQSGAVRSTLSLPLLCENRVIGVLTVYTSRADAYETSDLELLGGMADLAAITLENMRRVEELQRRSREAERLEEIGRVLSSSLDFEEVLERVSHAAMDLLEVDGAGVWTYEDGCATVRTSVGEAPVPVGTTVTVPDAVAEVLLTQAKPLWIEDVAADADLPDIVRSYFQTGSAILTPIVVGDRVVGALSARSNQVRRFTEYDVRMLGRLAGQASVALDNAELHASIQALSLTDALTGLPNRRHLQLHLEREIGAAQRGRKLALVLLDLDSFKHYNDTLGHVVGDQILKAFGEVLLQENRAMNLVARYGGDEFVAVLSEGDEQGAQGYLARLHAGIKAHRFLASHGVTVSSGIAEFDSDQTVGFEELIQAADRRMYENKAAKRR
ncbi:MAG: diguanylate cyclase [Gemmatimonadetes bacterium]|nr:diguanylate cyclase [Gemmatimonadota bacterium]